MFCKNCGTEISDTAKFCSNCGNAINENKDYPKDEIEDNQVIFTLKPEYNILYQFVQALWNVITFSLCAIIIIIGIPSLIYNSKIFAIILILYIIIKMIVGNIQYKNLKYNFYKTKVEYIDGFLNKEEKELKYKFIREVTMSKCILERICGIGTIRIFTNASSGGYGDGNHNSMKGRNGIYIHCLKNVEEQYRIIKQIIDEGTLD